MKQPNPIAIECFVISIYFYPHEGLISQKLIAKGEFF